jgi:hypothetical protein
MILHHTTAVFLGPSLGVKEAREVLAAEYFPPARKGDIYRIIASGVRTVVLIDGVFHNTPSVWPREILTALEEGIQVIGAASMGALRAAELDRLGMLGYGTIFEWYRDAVIEGDDEVAVSHATAELGFRPLSEALVNIRSTLNQAIQDGLVSQQQAHQLLQYAKQLYYPERSYQKLLNSEVVNAWPEKQRTMIRDYFVTSAVNLKRRDAIGALRYAARSQPDGPAAGLRTCRSAEDLWQLDRLRLTGFLGTADIVTGETVLQLARKDPDLLASTRRDLSQRCFLLEWARQNTIRLEEEFLTQYIQRWEECHGIDADGAWLRANGLSGNFYNKLLRDRALTDWIVTKGPAHFHVIWDFQRALWREDRLRRSVAGDDRWVPAGTMVKAPLRVGDENEAADQIWVELSSRGFLLDWARQNGVSCPPSALQAYREEWGRPRAEYRETSAAEGCAFIEERALVDWMTSQGPNHFGILWAFEDALLRELQITGRAAELLQREQQS